MVHSSSASSTIRDVKLFQTGRAETTLATFFWIFVTFSMSRAMQYLNIEEVASDVQVESLKLKICKAESRCHNCDIPPQPSHT